MKYALTRKRYLQCSLKVSAFEHVLATSEKKNIFLAYVREHVSAGINNSPFAESHWNFLDMVFIGIHVKTKMRTRPFMKQTETMRQIYQQSAT